MLLDLFGLIASTKEGGDDSPGWNKAAWKRKQAREQAITETIEATYRRMMGIEPAPEVVAEIKTEVRKDEVLAALDYTQEMKLVGWLSQQINEILRQRDLDELDDEEALLLLI